MTSPQWASTGAAKPTPQPAGQQLRLILILVSLALGFTTAFALGASALNALGTLDHCGSPRPAAEDVGVAMRARIYMTAIGIVWMSPALVGAGLSQRLRSQHPGAVAAVISLLAVAFCICLISVYWISALDGSSCAYW